MPGIGRRIAASMRPRLVGADSLTPDCLIQLRCIIQIALRVSMLMATIPLCGA